MAIGKYSQLKIASNILDTTIKDMAKELDVSIQAIRGVCHGNITSGKISAYVEKKIEEADVIYCKHKGCK